MTFPKPLVFLGFALILAAVGGGIYKSATQSSALEETSVSSKDMMAQKAVALIFNNLSVNLKEEFKDVQDSQLNEFRKIHEPVYVSKYLLLNDKINSGNYKPEVIQEKNISFEKESIETLKNIFIRKYSLKKEE